MNSTDAIGPVRRIAEHDLTVRTLGQVRLFVYESEIGEIVALLHKQPTRGSAFPLRVQSACLYGESFGSLDCDCKAQLDRALQIFREAGGGVLIHLPQEGRGAGLFAKARAYALAASDGLDTVEAYEQLGLEVDSRSYEVTALVLEDMGIHDVRLYTNNSKKTIALQDSGIRVASSPLNTSVTTYNHAYLLTKREKLHHELAIEGLASPKTSLPTLVIGGAVVDHVFQTALGISEGGAEQAHHYYRRPGGKGFNLAVASARWGAQVTLIAAGGTNPDVELIHDRLINEGVRARLTLGSSVDGWPPQTAVVQPTSGNPTYVGWLGDLGRSLSAADITRGESSVRESRLILLTQEVSQPALRAVLDQAPSQSCRVLTASPIVSPEYRVAGEVLESMHIVVGTSAELSLLLGPGDDDVVPHPEIRLSRLINALVVRTDLRGRPRMVSACGPGWERPLVMQAPEVLVTTGDRGATSAIGNRNAFTSVFAIELCSALIQEDDLGLAVRSASRERVGESLRSGLVAESWVARTDGGYDKFPRRGDRVFFQWAKRLTLEVTDASGD